MSDQFIVVAEARADQGKGASRRLRHQGKVPAVIYGNNQDATSISLSANELGKQLKIDAFYSQVLKLTLAGTEQSVVLKDLQRHPVTGNAMHADFMRVNVNTLIRVRVPLLFTGGDICPGVKVGGGMVEHLINQVEVECLPQHLPQNIEVDLSALNVGESVLLSDLPVPADVTLLELKHGTDQTVALVQALKVSADDADADADAAGEDDKN